MLNISISKKVKNNEDKYNIGGVLLRGIKNRSRFRHEALAVLVAIAACFFLCHDVGAIGVSSYTELTEAISNGENEITLESDIEFSSLLTLSQDVKIIGNGKTLLRANGYLGGLFSIPTNKKLEINNLTIDGSASGWSMDYENRKYTGANNSGYIRVPTIDGLSDIIANASLIANAGELILNDSTIQNTRLAQYASDGKTNIYGSVVFGAGDNTINNSTIKHAGAYNAGGALYITGGSTVIKDSTINENAGGVGTMVVVNGGFMYIADANLTIENSKFKDNFAQADGGVAMVYRSNVDISDSEFNHNMVGNDGSVFMFESKNEGKSLVVEDSVFENNIGFATTGQSMGTIWQRPWYNSVDSPVVYKNLKFKGNTARTGAVIADYSSANTYVTVDNVEAYENNVNSGGFLYGQTGHYTIKNSYSHDNEGTNGLGVYCIGSDVTIDGTKIKDNNATSSGAGIYLVSGSLALKNSEITGNNSGARGGGIFVRGYSIMLAITQT